MSTELELACDVLVNRMIESDAPNYNQHILAVEDGRGFVVTVQLKGGQTPCQQLDVAKAYLQELTEHFEINEIDGDVIYFGEVDVIKQANLYLKSLEN